MKKSISTLFGLACFSLTVSSFAAPYAELELKANKNKDGSYTYRLELENQGPVMINAATPPWHVVYSMSGSALDAGGKLLDEDNNIVLFGIDTGRDDIEISYITDDDKPLHGSEEKGWADSDSDGIPNQVVAWHPPFGPWPEGTAILHGESVNVSFRANAKLDKVLVWVGGTDDNTIWVDGHDMGEDVFGIYDGTDGKYLSTFFERHINVKHKKRRGKRHHD